MHVVITFRRVNTNGCWALIDIWNNSEQSTYWPAHYLMLRYLNIKITRSHKPKECWELSSLWQSPLPLQGELCCVVCRQHSWEDFWDLFLIHRQISCPTDVLVIMGLPPDPKFKVSVIVCNRWQGTLLLNANHFWCLYVSDTLSLF